jgi:hypothetical protein
MTEPFESLIRNSIQAAVMGAMAGEISEIVVKEMKRAMGDYESEVTRVVRDAIQTALVQAFGPKQEVAS